MADEELRSARIAAHKAFDPVWENGLMTKRDAYEWLAGELEIAPAECQIGLLSLSDCLRVREAVWKRYGE